MSITNWLHLVAKNTKKSWLFLPETRDALALRWTKNCRSFLQGDLDVVDTSSSVFTARSQLTLNGVPQVRCFWGLAVAIEKGNGGKDDVTMWPTLNVDVKQSSCITCHGNFDMQHVFSRGILSTGIFVYIDIYVYWCTKWDSILHGMTRQNNSLPPKCCFPGDIAACFACISRICSDKMGCGSVGTRNSQIWHNVLNVVSFFKCSDTYFDQVTNFEKKTEKGLLFFVRIWLLYSWKDVPERMENCKQYIIFLYRWTPTMICSSRLVIGWFILRVGCEICPAGHWTFFWGI